MIPDPVSLVGSTQNDVHERFIGADIDSLPKPAAILDIAKVRRHCRDMLDAIEWLGVDFRAHVKTHKLS